VDWSTEDVKGWLKDLEMMDIAERVRETNLSGEQLLTLSSDEILDMLQIGECSFLVNLKSWNPATYVLFRLSQWCSRGSVVVTCDALLHLRTTGTFVDRYHGGFHTKFHSGECV
jgi:hypothetical protein